MFIEIAQIVTIGGKLLKPNYIRCVLLVLSILFLKSLLIMASHIVAQETEQLTSVKTETPRHVTIVSEKSYNGVLKPRVEAKVYANISAKIVSLNVKAGQTVAKGDVIAQSSAQEAGIAAIRAEVSLSVAKSQLTTTEANAQTRIETQLVTAKESVAEAEAKREDTKSLAEMRIRNQLIQAEVAYKAAEANLERARVSATQGLERAKAEFTKATSDFERDKVLHTKELISDSEYESSETRYKLVQSRHEESCRRSKTV